ncbi:alpha-L-rhamnosidase C-terminal domain-containing protein [Mariniphaga sp.]|uniref:alpha-L-rhamnosidase-related protein n=1 Tax=Mariniphaga sp. TaxID=1954475 RepID=UPI00356315A8
MKFIILIFFAAFSFFPAVTSEKNRPSELLCELLSCPELSVITNPNPTFSWIVNSQLNNDFQTAYQIILATSEKDLLEQENVFWNSEKVSSTKSSNIVYDGTPLPANSYFYWKVRTWDKNDNPSEWSIHQRFNTGDFNIKRTWPGESKWVKVELENGDTIWTFENRHPISYHSVNATKKVQLDKVLFFDFERSAFAVPEIQYKWDPADSEIQVDTIWVHLGEKAVGDSIDQKPGGGVLFRKYPFEVKPGKHTETLKLPRFVPRYPHSQAMPDHMPEVVPFRFIEIHSKNQDIKIETVTQQALYYQFDEEASYFSCSDSRLNAIYDLCRYSVKANTFNGDYAASERERMMYEADCYIHQMSHYAVDREFAIARYSLENMIFHATWPTEWIFHTILMAHADYWHTGNTKIIEKYFPELKAKLMLELASENHLISTKTGKQTPEFLKSIHFNGKELRDIVDWPHGGMGLIETNGETDNYDFAEYNTVVNAFHYKALQAMVEMAEAIGKKAEANQFKERAAKVKNTFNKTFFNAETGIYVDGIESSHSSLHANMFPLVFGLVEDFNKTKVIDFIKSKGMACGVYGANYLLEALFNENETEYGLQLLTSDSDRSWLNMLRVGSTMTTEAWDNRYKSNNGWSHAWSASPAHIIPRKIMGVEPLTPGFDKIRIAPQPGNLTEASCKVPTIKGPVMVHFINETGLFNLDFEIPANTSARVIIPRFYSKGQIILNNKSIVAEYDNGEYFFDTESGSHNLTIQLE